MSVTADVIQRVADLVARKYGGDYRRAFDHNDLNHDGFIDAVELSDILKMADVGNFIKRAAVVRYVLVRVDVARDGLISWDEFQSALTQPFPGGL